MQPTIHRSTFGVPKINLAEKKFGRLYVKSQDDPILRSHGKAGKRWEIMWNCTCECGQENVIVSGQHLKDGSTKSCGCLRTENCSKQFKKHGMSRTTEYNSYIMAMRRCHNLKDKNYGGRGIKFLFTSFEGFFKELGFKPKNTSLERIDNNGHYESGNVKWATAKEQAANRRTKRLEQFSTANLIKELNKRGFHVRFGR